MQGNIADKMSEGISDSQCVLVFITQVIKSMNMFPTYNDTRYMI